jgi:hypothetical protein
MEKMATDQMVEAVALAVVEKLTPHLEQATAVTTSITSAVSDLSLVAVGSTKAIDDFHEEFHDLTKKLSDAVEVLEAEPLQPQPQQQQHHMSTSSEANNHHHPHTRQLLLEAKPRNGKSLSKKHQMPTPTAYPTYLKKSLWPRPI